MTKQSRNKGPAKTLKTQPAETPPVTELPNEEEWTKVKTKPAPAPKEGAASDPATTRARRPKVRPPAVLVKIATGSIYADTVRALRGPGGVDLADAGVNAESIKLRRTRDGHLLVELPKSKDAEAAAGRLGTEISTKLGERVGAVAQLGSFVEMEVVDIDAAADRAEVLAAVRSAIPGDQEDPIVKSERDSVSITGLWGVRSGYQVATLKVSRYVATSVLKVKIGWSICPMRARKQAPPRCYRCHGFGHRLSECKGPDLSAACRRGGESGHSEKSCQAGNDRCVACDRAGGLIGAHWAAQQLLAQTVAERQIGVVILSEYFRPPNNYPSWAFSTDGKSSIALTCNAGRVAEETGSGLGFAWLRFGGLRVFSCYWTPNGPTAADRLVAFHGFLDGQERAIGKSQRATETLIVAGDFNAKSQYWGSSTGDSKGEALEAFAASLGLWANNEGGRPTFQRRASTSIIDVTFSGPGQFEVVDWKVLEDYSTSDHRYVTFSVNGRVILEPVTQGNAKWAFRKLDEEALIRKIEQSTFHLVEPSTVDEVFDHLNEYLSSVCDSCMPRRYADSKYRSVHWWSQEISDLRKACIKSRRAYLRAVKRRGPVGSQREKFNFREARKALRSGIRSSQERSWAELCKAVDSDPWGIPYRIVMKKIGRQKPGIAAIGRENVIADALFPARPTVEWSSIPVIIQRHATQEAETVEIERPPLTLEEFSMAAARLPRGKATGPDGVPNEVLSVVAKKAPGNLMSVFE